MSIRKKQSSNYNISINTCAGFRLSSLTSEKSRAIRLIQCSKNWTLEVKRLFLIAAEVIFVFFQVLIINFYTGPVINV